MIGALTSICTGVAVSLIVFFVTRFYSSTQAKKAAEMERKEAKRVSIAQKNSDKIDALTELTKATAQHKIVTIGNAYLAQKAITTNEKTMLEDIYEPYRKLGGNGLAKTIMDEVEKLPVVVEE